MNSNQRNDIWVYSPQIHKIRNLIMSSVCVAGGVDGETNLYVLLVEL